MGGDRRRIERRAVRRRPRPLPPRRAGRAAPDGRHRVVVVEPAGRAQGHRQRHRGARRRARRRAGRSPAAPTARRARRAIPRRVRLHRRSPAASASPTGSSCVGRRRPRRRAGAAALGRRRRLRAVVRAVRHRAARGDGLRPAGRSPRAVGGLVDTVVDGVTGVHVPPAAARPARRRARRAARRSRAPRRRWAGPARRRVRRALRLGTASPHATARVLRARRSSGRGDRGSAERGDVDDDRRVDHV